MTRRRHRDDRATARTGSWLPFAVLLPLAIAPGCRSDATDPEVSVALARAFHERLQEQAAAPADMEAPGWPRWQADLFTVGFEGIDDGLALPEPLRDATKAYWDGNEVLEVPAEWSLSEQGQALAAYRLEADQRFVSYATALQAMADEEDEETAARGLLAMAVTLHQSSAQSFCFQYPRLALLDREILDGEYALTPPPCPLFGPAADPQGTLLDCGVPWRQRWDLEVDVLGEVLGWLDEIEDEDEDSPWRETVMAARSEEQIRVKPSANLALPESTARTEVELAVNVVISTQSISVDGVEAVRFPGGIPAGAAAVGSAWQVLQGELRDKAAAAKAVAAKRSTAPSGAFVLQCDESAPLSLVDDVMAAAAQAGLIRPQLVVFPPASNPLLRYSSIRAIPVTYVAGPKGIGPPAGGAVVPPGIPVLAIGPEGFELRAPRSAQLSAEPASGLPYAALTAEMTKLHTELGDGRLVAIPLDGDPGARYKTLIATADAVREHGCGTPTGCQELFPDLLLLAGSAP